MYLIIMFKCGHFHYYNSFSYQVKHPKTKRYLRGEFQFLTIWSILKQTQKIPFLVLLISSELHVAFFDNVHTTGTVEMMDS